MRVPSLTRRAFLVTAPTILAACTSPEKMSPFWATMVAPFKGVPPNFEPEYVEKVPYASIQAWFDNSPKALLVLGEYEGEDRLRWYSAENQILTTFGPFVVKALGTEVELRGTILSGKWHVDLREMVARRVERVLDLEGPGRASVLVRSRFELDGLEDIQILGKVRQLRLIKERAVAGGRFRYTNRYWVDPATGFCWKSSQIVAPTMPHLNIEVTKAPTRAT